MNVRAIRAVTACLIVLASTHHAAAAGPATRGPVLNEFGPVFGVPEGSLNLEPGRIYRVLFDVSEAPDDPAVLNRRIESAARFLNMHARHGIDTGDLRIAVVLHGQATRNALHDRAHLEKYGVPNGNRALLEALDAAGVDIYLCGQSAARAGITPANLAPEVRMAVSAMTVHVRLQQEGYRAVLF